MAVCIEPADPSSDAAVRLLTASHALMRSLFADACHFLTIDALSAPHITFWLARVDGQAVGCCALARKDKYAEVKSMFVDPDVHGQGVGEALLSRVIETARSEGITNLRLETGDKLESAQRLYMRAGFAVRGPFGGYENLPVSVFMEMRLT